MVPSRPHFRSFAGGEITPELFGRIDLTKFQTGLALTRNFWILAHGPAQNRNGFGFVNETRISSKKSVLIPFAYNTEQTFVIEFGEQYIRWHTNGGTLIEGSRPISNITNANPPVVTSAGHGFANGQWVYLTTVKDKFVLLPGAVGSHVTTPDSAALDITEDIDIRMRVGLVNWTPTTTNTLFAKGSWASPVNAAYAVNVNTNGTLQFLIGNSPTTNVSVASTVSTGFAAGSAHWIRVTRERASGTVTFYTSEDGVAWTQLGATQVLAAGTAINNSSYPLWVGNFLDTGTAGGQPTNGRAYILEIRNGISGTIVAKFNEADAALGATSWTSTTGEVWTLAGNAAVINGGMFELSGRFLRVAGVTTDTFTLEDLPGNPLNATAFSPYAGGGATASRVAEIWSPYLEADLPYLHFAQSEDVLTITHRNYKPHELRRLGPTSWQLVEISFVPTLAAPAPPTVVATTGSGTVSYSYKTTALAEGTLEESLPSTATAVTNDLAISGNKNTITPATVVGAVRYNIYKLFNGLYGYIGQTEGSGLVDNNITPDVSRTPAVHNDPFTTATNYPAAVGYYESRRVFAGTILRPQSYWLTRSATESNLSYSVPTRDDDTIQGRVKASEVNAIRAVMSASNALVFLTSGGPWKLAPTNSDVLTPSSALPKQISGEGVSEVPPAKTADEIVYASDAGNRIFSIKYRWDADGLVTEDLSLMVPHLFENVTVTSMTYSKGNKMLWHARSDGKLLGETYLPRHEVNAFHQHETVNGEFESVCSVKEGLDYPVYAVVKRVINGRTVRYIERMSALRPAVPEDAFFVDSGVSYSGPATTEVGGLWHLIGQTVAVLADGGEQVQQEVPDTGKITLDSPCTKVHVGLPITADLQTLPLILEGQPAAGQASEKNIGELWLRVRETGGLFIGPSFEKLREYPARSNEDFDSPPRLKSGVIHMLLENDWDFDSRVCIRQTAPLPVTIASMTMLVATNG